jgi:hypothetical protein
MTRGSKQKKHQKVTMAGNLVSLSSAALHPGYVGYMD